MSDEREAESRVSILRIVGGLTLSLGVFWFAMPFWSRWFFAAPGIPEEDVFLGRPPLFTPWPYIGLIVILFGLGFLGIARGGWLLPTIVALVALVIAMSCVPH
jgi:hypothetical protein